MGYTAAALRSWPVLCAFGKLMPNLARSHNWENVLLHRRWAKTMVGVEWKSTDRKKKAIAERRASEIFDWTPDARLERCIKISKMRSHKWLMCSRICGNWRPALRVRYFRFLFLTSRALSCGGRSVKHKMHSPHKNYGIKTRNKEEFYQNTHSS